LDGFESQTAQTSSQFFPIPSNPCVLGITEQALNLTATSSRVQLASSTPPHICADDVLGTVVNLAHVLFNNVQQEHHRISIIVRVTDRRSVVVANYNQGIVCLGLYIIYPDYIV
jgi:hypothetical protein